MTIDLERWRRTPSWAVLAAILALALGLFAVPISWGLPDYEGWAVDEVSPSWIDDPDKWSPKYPPLHRHLLRALFWPLDLVDGAPTEANWLPRHTRRFLLARALSLVMALATVWLVYRSARLLHGRAAGLAAALAATLMPPFVYYAKTANLEAPYLFWFAASVFFLLRLLERHRLRDYLLTAACATAAVCTKDQAYALYVLVPPAVLWGLFRRYRRERAGPGAALAATLADRRPWAALATAAGLFALVYGLPWTAEELGRHLRMITGPRTFQYQEFAPGLAGHLEMAGQAVTHTAFALGWPLFLAALAGLALAAAAPRRGARTLLLGAIAPAYYAAFIAVIHYHYVRFWLPVALVLAIPAGQAVARMLAGRTPWRRRAATLAAAAIFGYSLLRALSVDAAMLVDARYRAEAWLAERGATPATAIGFGSGGLLPRGVRALKWGWYVGGGCRYLDGAPRWIAVNLAEPREAAEEAALATLLDGSAGYETVFRHRGEPPVDWLRLEGVHTNLARINGEIVVFERRPAPCVDASVLAERLQAVRETPGDGALRAALARAILDGDLPGRRALAGGAAAAVGLYFDGWSRGTEPAAVAVRNLGQAAARPRLELGCWAPPGELPIAVTIDDGPGARGRVVFERRGQRRLELAPLAAGEERLIVLWSERAWRPAGGDERRLGVNVTALELAETG